MQGTKVYVKQVYDHTNTENPLKASYLYEVTKVINSTTPRVGDRLTKEEVDAEIAVGSEVTIT